MTIAVVGTGAVTALGPSAQDLWQGARSGRVAIGPVRGLPMQEYRTRVAGEVAEIPFSGTGCRDRALELAIAAAHEALGDLPRSVPPERCGIVLGTCNAGVISAWQWLKATVSGEYVDPRLVAGSTPQALAEALAVHFSFQGPVLAVNTACASGTNAIGLAADLIRLGRADFVLAGGTDGLSEVAFAGFDALGSLSEQAAAPYCGSRSGLSLGEGSGMVALASPVLAQDSRWPVLAEVLAYGLSADGYHVTAPRPDGSVAAQAMRSALARAGARTSKVGYVNGHGTGTGRNDSAETKAIRLAFGAHADQLLVSSTKSVIGHLLGAAGAVEAIVTVRALAEGVAPPTAGYTRHDPDCDLDYVAGDARRFEADLAVSNSFAFAGANASVVLAKPGSWRVPEPTADRVVITGMSVITPAGNEIESAWQALRRGVPVRSGVRVDPDPHLDRRARRRMDRLAVFSVITAARALASAGITDPESAGIVFGTGNGPMEAMADFALPLLAEGRSAANPGVFPNTVYNQAAGQVAKHLGLRGPTSTLSVGHATGAAAISYAADLVATGHGDTLLVTVTDTVSAEVVQAYADNGLPPTCLLAEGSVTLVLERRSTALARGATVLAELLGSGTAFDGRPRRPWDPRGTGLERAMHNAMADGDSKPEEIDTLWLNACGLAWADRAEQRAVHRVFTEQPTTYEPKRVLGEPAGVGGALSTALAVHGLAGGTALVNSSSLGGTHVSLLLGADR
ncbi:hypothetical protein GCM10010174_17990 [Kutzneria viridogrisea]|uniref:3-oxoacyl-[acyl-carrier-protein] synthase II n=1 Tax=Kutzneria viridogrisea TaxID=47990 RepID=A0ABR6B7G1_9PSEU|nr:3-oxoacyl-[acyl-carrier-protein] synthase II [Kutzneria viridogrisea]